GSTALICVLFSFQTVRGCSSQRAYTAQVYSERLFTENQIHNRIDILMHTACAKTILTQVTWQYIALDSDCRHPTIPKNLNSKRPSDTSSRMQLSQIDVRYVTVWFIYFTSCSKRIQFEVALCLLPINSGKLAMYYLHTALISKQPGKNLPGPDLNTSTLHWTGLIKLQRLLNAQISLP